MQSNKKQKSAYISALFTVILWASAFPAVRYCLEYYSPQSIMLFRFLISSAIFIIIAFIKKIRLPYKKDLLLFITDGLIGIFFYMLFLNMGTKLVPSGISSFIVSSAPIFSIILSILILKEKIRINSLIGILISFFGLILITVSQINNFSLNIGILLLIGSALSTSLHSIFQRQLLKIYTPIETTTYSIFFATLFMLLFIPDLIKELPETPLAVNSILIYLGVFPAAIAFLLWGYALSKTEKTVHITMFLYLAPFISSLIAYFWLHEKLSFLAVSGGIIIILGMILSDKTLIKNKITDKKYFNK